MSKTSLALTIAHWEKLLAAAESSSREIPQMEALRLKLGTQMEDVKTLRDRRSALRAEMNHSTRELRSFQIRGRELASRLQALARACFVDRETLNEFGIKPRGRRKPCRVRVRKEEGKDEAPRNPTTR